MHIVVYQALLEAKHACAKFTEESNLSHAVKASHWERQIASATDRLRRAKESFNQAMQARALLEDIVDVCLTTANSRG